MRYKEDYYSIHAFYFLFLNVFKARFDDVYLKKDINSWIIDTVVKFCLLLRKAKTVFRVSLWVFFLQLFRVEVLFNERKHFVLRRGSEFQALHRKVSEKSDVRKRNWTPRASTCGQKPYYKSFDINPKWVRCYLVNFSCFKASCRLHCVKSAAQKNHPDARLPEQKEPAPEDQTSGAEEAGAGGLHPGKTKKQVSAQKWTVKQVFLYLVRR